jgi:hypothetical protein
MSLETYLGGIMPSGVFVTKDNIAKWIEIYT